VLGGKLGRGRGKGRGRGEGERRVGGFAFFATGGEDHSIQTAATELHVIVVVVVVWLGRFSCFCQQLWRG